MSYFHICSACGAYLDPGEICDCREKEIRKADPLQGETRRNHMIPKHKVGDAKWQDIEG